MKNGIQSFLISAGDNACYALDIIKLAEEVLNQHIDIIVALESGIDKKYIKFNYDDYNDPDNFYVLYAHKFLSLLTNQVWIMRHERADYKPKQGEYIIQRWERVTTGKTYSHFRLPEWDSLADSQTVKYGKLVSTRLFINVEYGG